MSVGWHVKTYSISVHAERVDEDVVERVRQLLPGWLTNCTLYDLPTYRIATLIVHEGREGYFAIVSWWIDSNMLQTSVYFSTDPIHRDFRLFSDNGIFTCIWEMAVLWFERNAWVECVLKAPKDPQAFVRYMEQHFNADV
ncbi:MAG: hypothetical protein WAU70_11970 [Flavobacteriales bacterium]